MPKVIIFTEQQNNYLTELFEKSNDFNKKIVLPIRFNSQFGTNFGYSTLKNKYNIMKKKLLVEETDDETLKESD
jgi:hypothetical protein